MATLLKVLSNLADIKSAGGVALRVRTQGTLDPKRVKDVVTAFFALVDKVSEGVIVDGTEEHDKSAVERAARYERAAIQASNDRGNRVTRGSIIRELLAMDTE